nr:MAG TPA: hypothetical protein [Caudoviricetes sp.]
MFRGLLFSSLCKFYSPGSPKNTTIVLCCNGVNAHCLDTECSSFSLAVNSGFSTD